MLKHRVNLLIKALELLFVFSQVLLVLRHCCFTVSALHHGRIPEPHILNLEFLVDLADGVEVLVHSVNLRVLQLFVPVLDEFGALFIHRAAHFADIATETGRKHVLMQCRELLEDSVVKEILCESVRFHLG